MGNCLEGLSKCIDEIKDGGNNQPYELKIDQLLLKRLILLEERVIEQEMDMKSVKTLLSRLEMRRLEDKEKMRALASSIKKIKELLYNSRQNRNVSWKDDEDRITMVGGAIKDLKLKLDAQGSLLRELSEHEDNYIKDENHKLVDALEKGIQQGRKHLANLEELFEPFSLLIDSDNSLRKWRYEHKALNTTASSL